LTARGVEEELTSIKKSKGKAYVVYLLGRIDFKSNGAVNFAVSARRDEDSKFIKISEIARLLDAPVTFVISTNKKVQSRRVTVPINSEVLVFDGFQKSDSEIMSFLDQTVEGMLGAADLAGNKNGLVELSARSREDLSEICSFLKGGNRTVLCVSSAGSKQSLVARPSFLPTEKTKENLETIVEEKEEASREATEREEAERNRIAREKEEKDRLQIEELEKALALEKAEKERLSRERAEREKAEKERIAREKAERERIAREKAKKERIAREKAEKERIAREKAEKERIAREKAERERIAREKAEKERIEREKQERRRSVIATF
jgi:hypothetical protein